MKNYRVLSCMLLMSLCFMMSKIAVAALPVTTGLIAHYEADAITGVDDANDLSLWPSTSGAVSADLAPTSGILGDFGVPSYHTNVLNGLPVVRFKTEEILASPTFTLPDPSQGVTLMSVLTGSTKGTNATEKPFQFGSPTGTIGQYMGTDMRADVTNSIGYRFGNGFALKDNILSPGFHICTWQMAQEASHGDAKLFVDSNARVSGMNINNPGNVLTFPSDCTVTVGSGFNNGGGVLADSYKGDVAEVVVYNRQLTVEEIASVGQYLAAKYNLTFENNPTSIISQPRTQTAAVGETASFNIEAAGAPGDVFGYQWYFNGAPLSGETSSELVIDDVQLSDLGEYYCRVDNLTAGSSLDSDEAALVLKKLRAHWTLDESDFDYDMYLDQTDEHNDLWCISSDPNFTSGISGDAVDMSDHDGWGDVYFDPSASSEQISVSLWVNWDGYAPQVAQALVSKREHSSWTLANVHWGLNNFPANSGDIRFESPASSPVAAVDALQADGQWQHVVASFDGETASVYVDGYLKASGPFSLGEAPDAPVIVGSVEVSYPDGIMSFNGSIDDVKVFNYALDKYEVAGLYYGLTSTQICADPPAYDFTDDCKVDMADFAEFAGEWLESGLYPEI